MFGAGVITTVQLYSTKPKFRFSAVTMGTFLWQGLKVFNLFRLLWKETMEMFSIGERNKSKHKLVWKKPREAEEGTIIFYISQNLKPGFWLVCISSYLQFLYLLQWKPFKNGFNGSLIILKFMVPQPG